MSADVIVTVTGGTGVWAERPRHFKDGVIIANAGHFPLEVDAKGIAASPEVNRRDLFEDAIEDELLPRPPVQSSLVATWSTCGAPADGQLIETMDLGFALQARSLEAVALGRVGRGDCVVPVPRAINEQVAEAYLNGRYS